ncbi:MAG: hypothetical protein LBJ19_00305 [Holosporaceae bacterium]|jgi:hypothetical protein|nr:hypothetical protein [Holosporaceae bacterium]
MFESLVYCILKFGHVDVIVFIIMGILFHRSDDYETAACFVCFVMIFNQLLKDLFKVPLFPHLGSSYAFPSGHMHAAMAFYGYIFARTKNIFAKAALVMLLGSIGFALVYCNFHDWIDVLGAVGFGITEICIYLFVRRRVSEKIIAGLVLGLSLLIMLMMCHYAGAIKSHVWLAMYTLVSIIVCKKLWGGITLPDLKCKLLSTVLIFASIYVIHKLGGFVFSRYQELYLQQLKFLFFPVAVLFPMFMVKNIIVTAQKLQKTRKA